MVGDGCEVRVVGEWEGCSRGVVVVVVCRRFRRCCEGGVG